MKLATGIDLIETSRIREAIERHGERFLARVFTPAEREICQGRVESLSARYAAKEAFAKALGTGIRGFGFLEIEILRGPLGEPQLRLYGPALELAQAQGWSDWSVSLSHTESHAVAVVTALKE